jgi:hypothetical protein
MSEPTVEPNLINSLASGIVVGIGTLMWIAHRFFSGGEEKEAQKHMVLESAELADMTPFRLAVVKLDQVIAMKADMEQLRKDNVRILEILEKLDRAEDVEREVQLRLQDVRMREELHERRRRGQAD